MNNYIICHDLPEAITGNITKFEVSDNEIKRVTDSVVNYLSDRFGNVLDFGIILNNY